MNGLNIGAKWSSWAPRLQSLLRIVAAFIFVQSGTLKLFAFPIGMPPNGARAAFLSEFWFAGVLETVGGVLLLVGLLTRPVAFLLAGEMAVAYFQFSEPISFWTVANNGVAAALYAFLWLYFSAAGPGPWSLDAVRAKRRLQ